MHSLIASERTGLLSIRQSLTCSLCVKLLDDPHCLDCKHNFCGLCIREYARDYQHLGCPKCRLPIYPSEIIRNHSLQNLLQAWQSVEEALDSCSHDLEDDERNELCSSQQTETTLLLTQELQEYQKLVDEKAAFIQNYEISNLLREDSGDSNPSDVHSPNLESNAQDSEQPKSTAAEPIQYNPTESIRKNHTCVKRHVLATSSLTKTQRLTVKKACEALGGDLEHKLHQDVSTSSSLLVTHLITTSKSESLNNTSQKFRRCKRTAKYMLALANGIFIVDFSWILASLAAAQWIDEEKYEVDGDIHTEVMGKPRESRLHRVQTGRTSDIFSLFRFVLLFRLEDYEYHVDSLQAVVFAFEGRMLPEDHLSALETSENATRTCVGIVPRGTPAQSAREKYHQYHIPIVQIAWIVDCISHLEILPFGEYFPY